MDRKSGLKTGTAPLKRSRIAPKGKVAPSAAELAGREAWAAATAVDNRCACCGRRGACHGHHVILKRHVVQRGGDPWDLRNRLSLLPDHHLGHHESSGRHRIPQSVLRPENLAFARELLGDDAQAYLDRHYPLAWQARED